MEHTDRILNLEESRNQDKNWQWTDIAGATGSLDELPESVDLRGSRPSNWWGRPEDQGQTGACVGYSLGTVLHWHLEKEGIVARGDAGRPSFKHIWMASKESDRYTSYETSFLNGAGTYLDSALNVLRKRGTVLESVLPMDSQGTLMNEQEFYVLASQFKIKSSFAVSPWGEGHGFEGYKYWLANHGPIQAAIQVDRGFMFANRNTGVLKNYGGGLYGGHAICIAGYRPGEFLVKNSWGTKWGDRGFLWVSEDYAKQAFYESYGIVV
jgi:C1A family cysteine protease